MALNGPHHMCPGTWIDQVTMHIGLAVLAHELVAYPRCTFDRDILELLPDTGHYPRYLISMPYYCRQACYAIDHTTSNDVKDPRNLNH